MAIYPCDVGNHRYPQPQQSGYISLVQGATAVTYRLRLCPRHFREVTVAAREHLQFVDEAASSSEVCIHCGAEKTSILFARLFPARAEEMTYAGDLCSDHAITATVDLHVAQMEPLPPRTDPFS